MENNEIKVSVIVPVYNVQEYIEECVNSLVQQTLSDIEILLIDDGSTDGSEDICDRYAENYKNIRVIHKENGGLGSARNVGLTNAKGKYVYFIDSDDFLDVDALHCLYQEAEKDCLDVILFSAECFSDDENIEFNANQYIRTAFLDMVKCGRELFLKLYAVKEYYVAIPLRFYKREFLINNAFLFPEGIIHEDEVFGYLSLWKAERAKCMPDAFYKRRYRKGSIITSARAYKSAMGCFYTWQKLMEFYVQADIKDAEKKSVLRFINGFIYKIMKFYFQSFTKVEKHDFKKIAKNIREELYFSEVSFDFKLFFVSPTLYKIYEKLMHMKQKPYEIKREVQMKLVYYLAILQLFIVHNFCKDKSAVILIGTPTHGNLGDQAIVYAQRKFFKRFKSKMNIVEITSQQYLSCKERFQETVSPQDLIIIDGGGSMGTLWIKNEYRFRDVVERFPKNRVFILPQTVYFSQDDLGKSELKKSMDIYSNHKNLVIFCRDEDSYNFVKGTFTENKSYYMPDMVLSVCPELKKIGERSGVLFCLREDKEGIVDKSTCDSITDYLAGKGIIVKKTSTIIDRYVTRFSRKKELQRKWEEFSRAKLVITDRLHAMIFCAITKTPCIALDNISHKVKGGYDWIKSLPYIHFWDQEIPSKEQIENILHTVYKEVELDIKGKYDELQCIIERGNMNDE